MTDKISDYDKGYFDGINAALHKSIELARKTHYENDGRSAILVLATYLNNIKDKQSK